MSDREEKERQEMIDKRAHFENLYYNGSRLARGISTRAAMKATTRCPQRPSPPTKQVDSCSSRRPSCIG